MNIKQLSFNLDSEQEVPLYLQLYQQLKMYILTVQVAAGTRLPATRKFAAHLGVARVTVAQAYQLLEKEGFVESRQGAGTFVTAVSPISETEQPFRPTLSPWGVRMLALEKGHHHPTTQRSEIDFGFGRSFPHIFPYDIWRRLLARYLSTDDVMLSRYGSVAGFYPLRVALADYLAEWRGVRCTPEQIVVVNGAQQAIDLLARLLLAAGDEVLVETPGYIDAFDLFRVHGAQLRPLPVDQFGFPVQSIPEDCAAKLAFVTPSNQFPRGGTMPLQRRLELLQWAQTNKVLIVEDDYDGVLRYDGRPLSALQGLDQTGQVIYLGTFSKVLFPALRLSYVVLPSQLVKPFIQAKQVVDRGAPTLTQAAVSDFITEGHFERHLRHLRQAYGQKRQTLEGALQTHLGDSVQYVSVPAGLHIMLDLPVKIDEGKLVQAARKIGVGLYGGKPYHLQPAPNPSILLGFSGVSESQIEEGVRRLAHVMHEMDQ